MTIETENSASELVEIELNDRIEQAPKGARLIDWLAEQGIEIPRFCYHPALEVVGQCRLCQVEVEGPGRAPRRMAISCRTDIAAGMKVWTHSEAALRTRRSVLEFLLKDHPLDCPICDKAGECPLQNYTFGEHQSSGRSHEERRKRRKRVDLGEVIILDQERCVLCTRCVRYFEELEGRPQLGVMGMGNRSHIDTVGGQPLRGNYQGNLADICPVGALTLKNFRFQARVWNLRPNATICPGCSRGCSINLETYRGKARRIRPRYNPRVNGHWICDAGRFGYEELNIAGRLAAAIVRDDGGWEESAPTRALELGREHLAAGGGRTLLVASPYATCEEGEALLALSNALGARARVLVPPPSPLEDEILHTAERGPNLRGLREIGLEDISAERMRRALSEESTALLCGDHALELAWAPELGEDGAQEPDLDPGLILLAIVTRPIAGAAICYPARSWGERSGTWVNCEGLRQKIRPALAPPAGTMATLEILEELTRIGAATPTGGAR